MEQRNKWQVKRIVTIVVLSILAACVLFLVLFFPIRAWYWSANPKTGGRYAIFKNNFGDEIRVDLKENEKSAVREIAWSKIKRDRPMYFSYKIYYSDNDEFTGEADGYWMNEHRELDKHILEKDNRYNYLMLPVRSDDFQVVLMNGTDYTLTAYADQYDHTGKFEGYGYMSIHITDNPSGHISTSVPEDEKIELDVWLDPRDAIEVVPNERYVYVYDEEKSPWDYIPRLYLSHDGVPVAPYSGDIGYRDLTIEETARYAHICSIEGADQCIARENGVWKVRPGKVKIIYNYFLPSVYKKPRLMEWAEVTIVIVERKNVI